MSVRVSCPYCNHAVTLAEPPAAGRVTCPRCRDPFPFRAPAEDDGDEPAFADAPAAGPVVSEPVARRGWSVRRTVAVCVLLGLVGLGVGLGVAYYRGGHHPEPAGPDAPPSGAVVPTTELAGVRFLPAGCNVVAAVQAGPVLAYAARTNQDPRELLAAAGLPQQAFATLDQAGLPLQQIDHLAAGLIVPDREGKPAAAVVVLVLRRPLDDEDAFLRALKAAPDPNGKKDRYTAGIPGLLLQPEVVRVSGREWVFVWGDAAQRAAVADAGPGGGHLSAGLRELLREKVPEAAVCLAADDTNWADKPVVKLVVERLLNRPRLLPLLAKGEAVAAGLSFGDPPRARVYVRTTDAVSAEQVRMYFQGKAGPGAMVGGSERMAFYDAPFDPRAGTGPLRRFLEDARK